jgi:hypothetical protein
MNSFVIEHVPVSDLPVAWQAKLAQPKNARVTVRIEEEVTVDGTDQAGDQGHPKYGLLFGMWRDREDMADVESYVRNMREDRVTQEPTTKP